MDPDDLDLSEFEDFSSTARKASSGAGGKGGGGGASGGGRPPDGKGGPRRWLWLLAGIVAGVLGALFLPDLAAPYLPAAMRPAREEVTGPVLEKRAEGERLLLTVNTDRGALLATFRRRVPEIDLLVERGDTITLGLKAYRPLVEDPVLAGVRKGGAAAAGRPATPPPAGGSEAAGAGADPPEGAAGDSAPGGAGGPDTAGGDTVPEGAG